MYLIKNNHYFDLAPYVNMKELERIYPKIALGIVRAGQAGYIKDSGAEYENFLNKQFPSITNVSESSFVRDTENPYYKYYEYLKFDLPACRTFNKYVMDVSMMGQLLILRGYGHAGIYNKHIADVNYDYPAYSFFPALKKWIDNLKIFDSVGRVIFWFNAAGEPASVHRDTFLGYPDHFLLVNLRPERKDLFVVNPETNEEMVIPTKAYVFDTRNYHGTRGKDFSGFTFRIDGVYNKEWAESVGIWDHFNPENYKY
jgi:hypothetical protein